MLLRSLVLAALMATASPAFGQAPAIQDTRTAERDLLKKTVEIPTVAGRGEMPRLIQLLSDEFRKIGITNFAVKPHEGRAGDKTATMIARWPAKNATKRPILLMAHLDVVEAKRPDWDSDPFEFREKDGYFHGRGTFDMKSGVVAIVAALQRLKAAGITPNRDLIVLFTGDEETAQRGARLASTDWKPLIDAEFALNLDAGGGFIHRSGRADHFFIQIAEKTYADYTLTTTNRGGHSSEPRPDNAIYQLAAALKTLEEYRFAPRLIPATRAFFEGAANRDGGRFGELVKAWLGDPDNMEKADKVEAVIPGYTRTRCVATQIAGGHARNALPQKAEANVNCRIFPGTSPAEVQRELQAIAGKEVKVELTNGGTSSEPSLPREDVMTAARAAVEEAFPGAPLLAQMSAGASDAVFTRAAGIPTYGIGFLYSYLGEPTGSHGNNERALVRGFYDQIDMLETILLRLVR